MIIITTLQNNVYSIKGEREEIIINPAAKIHGFPPKLGSLPIFWLSLLFPAPPALPLRPALPACGKST